MPQKKTDYNTISPRCTYTDPSKPATTEDEPTTSASSCPTTLATSSSKETSSTLYGVGSSHEDEGEETSDASRTPTCDYEDSEPELPKPQEKRKGKCQHEHKDDCPLDLCQSDPCTSIDWCSNRCPPHPCIDPKAPQRYLRKTFNCRCPSLEICSNKKAKKNDKGESDNNEGSDTETEDKGKKRKNPHDSQDSLGLGALQCQRSRGFHCSPPPMLCPLIFPQYHMSKENMIDGDKDDDEESTEKGSTKEEVQAQTIMVPQEEYPTCCYNPSQNLGCPPNTLDYYYNLGYANGFNEGNRRNVNYNYEMGYTCGFNESNLRNQEDIKETNDYYYEQGYTSGYNESNEACTVSTQEANDYYYEMGYNCGYNDSNEANNFYIKQAIDYYHELGYNTGINQANMCNDDYNKEVFKYYYEVGYNDGFDYCSQQPRCNTCCGQSCFNPCCSMGGQGQCRGNPCGETNNGSKNSSLSSGSDDKFKETEDNKDNGTNNGDDFCIPISFGNNQNGVIRIVNSCYKKKIDESDSDDDFSSDSDSDSNDCYSCCGCDDNDSDCECHNPMMPCCQRCWCSPYCQTLYTCVYPPCQVPCQKGQKGNKRGNKNSKDLCTQTRWNCYPKPEECPQEDDDEDKLGQNVTQEDYSEGSYNGPTSEFTGFNNKSKSKSTTDIEENCDSSKKINIFTPFNYLNMAWNVVTTRTIIRTIKHVHVTQKVSNKQDNSSIAWEKELENRKEKCRQVLPGDYVRQCGRCFKIV